MIDELERSARSRCWSATGPALLDGNHLAGTEHRIEVLRTTGSAPLPGQSLVVLDPELRLVVDVIPCEDGHAQERSLS